MSETLNRDEILALLERLGSDDDAEVLAAARTLHEAVAGAGIGWSALLAGENGDAAGDEAAATAGTHDVPPAAPGDRDAEALALIDKLLARAGNAEDFRRELEGYKADIAEGDFADADLEYLRAVEKRLSGKG